MWGKRGRQQGDERRNATGSCDRHYVRLVVACQVIQGLHGCVPQPVGIDRGQQGDERWDASSVRNVNLVLVGCPCFQLVDSLQHLRRVRRNARVQQGDCGTETSQRRLFYDVSQCMVGQQGFARQRQVGARTGVVLREPFCDGDSFVRMSIHAHDRITHFCVPDWTFV